MFFFFDYQIAYKLDITQRNIPSIGSDFVSKLQCRIRMFLPEPKKLPNIINKTFLEDSTVSKGTLCPITVNLIRNQWRSIISKKGNNWTVYCNLVFLICFCRFFLKFILICVYDSHCVQHEQLSKNSWKYLLLVALLTEILIVFSHKRFIKWC